MKACELIARLAQNPNAEVVVLEGDDDHEHKRRMISVYISAESEAVIQYWD